MKSSTKQKEEIEMWLWHRRLGYDSFSYFKKKISFIIIKGWCFCFSLWCVWTKKRTIVFLFHSVWIKVLFLLCLYTQTY